LPLNRIGEKHKPKQAAKSKEAFTKPKARQRANRKRMNRAGVEPGITNNTFSILETDTDSEGTNREKKLNEEPKDKKGHKTKDGEENLIRTEVQMQELEEERDEDTNMLTSDGGSEELELNEVLEKEGVNLPVMEENWRTQGLENIPEE